MERVGFAHERVSGAHLCHNWGYYKAFEEFVSFSISAASVARSVLKENCVK